MTAAILHPPRRRLAGLAAALWLLSAGAAWADGITVSDPWIALPPPGAATNAGYLTIMHHSSAPCALVAAESPGYGRIQLHMSEVKDGVATMKHLDKVTLPATGTVSFAPGGMHLMLMKPKKALKEGDTVPIVLSFDNGERITVEAVVRKPTMAGAMHPTTSGMAGHQHEH